jgi:glutathione S-transferase
VYTRPDSGINMRPGEAPLTVAGRNVNMTGSRQDSRRNAARKRGTRMKLLSAPASPFGRKVKIVAIEKGLLDRIEIVAMPTTPAAPNEELARDNPLAKIPTLVLPDGRSLYDSFVICDYLDTLHEGSKAIPASGARRWEVLTVHALGNGIADAAILCRYETALRPEALRWPDWTRGQMKKVTGGLDWLESNVASIGSAGATDVDLGQIAVACALGYLDFRFADVDWHATRPRLGGWFLEFSQRASMQRTMPAA